MLDALGRTISVTDPLSNQSTVSYGLGESGVSGDNNTYATTTRVDANLHVQQGFADALGRSIYVLLDSGKSGGTLTPVQRTAYQYNALDEPTSVTVTDLAPQPGQTITTVTTMASYDDLGRMTSLNDPDRGSHTYSYDPDGRLVGDVSSSRTLGSSYDLLGRLGCLQDALPTADAHGACSSGANPFVQNTYDADPSGVTWSGSCYPVGQLTQSVATTYYPSPDDTQGVVTENTQYDQRGRVVTQCMHISASGGSLAFPTFPLYQEAFSYNDANQETTVQTTVGGQAGYVFTNAYDGTTGILNGLSNTATGTPTLAALTYNTRALISDVSLKDSSGGNLADENQQDDADLRPLSDTSTWQSGGTIYSGSMSYDAVGNVLSRMTSQASIQGVSGSGGNETQNFCYDEQNRLVWASNSVAATPQSGRTCGTATLQATLGSSYTSNYVSTHLGQLWQGPLNGSGAQEQYPTTVIFLC